MPSKRLSLNYVPTTVFHFETEAEQVTHTDLKLLILLPLTLEWLGLQACTAIPRE